MRMSDTIVLMFIPLILVEFYLRACFPSNVVSIVHNWITNFVCFFFSLNLCVIVWVIAWEIEWILTYNTPNGTNNLGNITSKVIINSIGGNVIFREGCEVFPIILIKFNKISKLPTFFYKLKIPFHVYFYWNI